MNTSLKIALLITLCGLILGDKVMCDITGAAPSPIEKLSTDPSQVQPSETQGLSLHEVEELKINEDEVMNPFPG